jgi:tyrosyl-tRNA synthetase
MEYKSKLLNAIDKRGYLKQCTAIPELDRLTDMNQIAVYIGFDCTASSLHVGSLVQIMLLRLLQRYGHRPIVLLGGGTTKMGDPSGKDEARKIISDEQIKRNLLSIKDILAKFLKFGQGKSDAIIVNNADWLCSINYVDFLAEYGRLFSVNKMLSFDSIKMRLDRQQNLSFLEFNYLVMQAYDFVELYKRYGCRLQIGGSDQWGNIVSGVELGQRLKLEPLFGLTSPLVVTASGAKMGKTAQGAVWLDEASLSAYDYWQYFRNTADEDVGHFLRLFTELPTVEIAKLESLKDQEINETKKILATEATRICHGDAAAELALKTAEEAFEVGHSEHLPLVRVNSAQIKITDLLRCTGFIASNGEAKRLIRGGAVRLDGCKIEDENAIVDLKANSKLSLGKKKHFLIEISVEH